MNNLQECIDLTVCIRSSSTYIEVLGIFYCNSVSIRQIGMLGHHSNFMHIYNKKHTTTTYIFITGYFGLVYCCPEMMRSIQIHHNKMSWGYPCGTRIQIWHIMCSQSTTVLRQIATNQGAWYGNQHTKLLSPLFSSQLLATWGTDVGTNKTYNKLGLDHNWSHGLFL